MRDGLVYFVSDRGGRLAIWSIPMPGAKDEGIQQVASLFPNSLLREFTSDIDIDVSPLKNELLLTSDRMTGAWNIWKVSVLENWTQMTSSQWGAGEADWSPDGTMIAFTMLDEDQAPYVWIMNADGKKRFLLGPGRQPDWSPDGAAIVFSREIENEGHNLWIASSDGTEERPFTSTNGQHELWPKWSANGSMIAFVVQNEYQEYLEVENGRVTLQELPSEIWIANAQTRKAVKITESESVNTMPSWSQNDEIVFVSNRNGGWSLWSTGRLEALFDED